MKISRVFGVVALGSLVFFAPLGAEAAEVTVTFQGCTESIGVALASTAELRERVPAAYALPGDGAPVTPLVVRAAHCDDVRVGRRRTGATNLVQIGAFLLPPDGTGDVNTYLFWYETTNAPLARVLRSSFGVNAVTVPHIDYRVGAVDATGAADFRVQVRRPGRPRLTLSGSVVPAGFEVTNFVANWWQETKKGTVKLSTVVPSGTIGGAALLLDTPSRGALARVLGAGEATFPVLEQFNTFASATMTVRATD